MGVFRSRLNCHLDIKRSKFPGFREGAYVMTAQDAEMPDDAFEDAVIELLGLEVLTQDKISPYEIAMRFYYRGVSDTRTASPSVCPHGNERGRCHVTQDRCSDDRLLPDLHGKWTSKDEAFADGCEKQRAMDLPWILPELQPPYNFLKLDPPGLRVKDYLAILSNASGNYQFMGEGPTPRQAVLNALEKTK